MTTANDAIAINRETTTWGFKRRNGDDDEEDVDEEDAVNDRSASKADDRHAVEVLMPRMYNFLLIMQEKRKKSKDIQ